MQGCISSAKWHIHKTPMYVVILAGACFKSCSIYTYDIVSYVKFGFITYLYFDGVIVFNPFTCMYLFLQQCLFKKKTKPLTY